MHAYRSLTTRNSTYSIESPSVILLLAIALAKPLTFSSSNADFKLYQNNYDDDEAVV